MESKCEKCKYCKDGEDAWSYIPYKYCNRGVSEDEIKDCEGYKEKYTIADALYDNAFGITIGLIFVFLSLLALIIN